MEFKVGEAVKTRCEFGLIDAIVIPKDGTRGIVRYAPEQGLLLVDFDFGKFKVQGRVSPNNIKRTVTEL